MQEQHAMQLEKTHPSGAEEWQCPHCAYRIVITWQPQFKKQVLQLGEDGIIHAGGKGGLTMGGMQTQPEKEVDKPMLPAVEEAIPLEPASPELEKLLKNSGLGHLL